MATVTINNATFFGTPEECAAFVRAMNIPPEAGVVSGSGTVEAVTGDDKEPELREGLRVIWDNEDNDFGGDIGTVTKVEGGAFLVQWDGGPAHFYSRSDFGVDVHPHVAIEQAPRGGNEP